MSIKKLGLSIFCTATVLAGFYFFKKNSSPTLNFAPTFPISQFSSKGVSNRIINLKLSAEEVETNDKISRVYVKINMPFDFNEKLFFRWKPGQDVIVSEGALNGELDRLLKNETKEISILVKGFSKQQNHHVGFEIYGFKNGRKIHGDALIASDPENTFENIVQNVEKIKASQ